MHIWTNVILKYILSVVWETVAVWEIVFRMAKMDSSNGLFIFYKKLLICIQENGFTITFLL